MAVPGVQPVVLMAVPLIHDAVYHPPALSDAGARTKLGPAELQLRNWGVLAPR